MAKAVITNAAGRTTGFFYETGKTRDVSASETEVVMSARITEGRLEGERVTITLIGRFDLDAGTGRVSEWRESVGDRLHFRLTLDRAVSDDDLFAGNLREPLQITGNRFDNRLEGARTDDRLAGMAGDDRLAGMRGADDLVGGFGADRFYFLATADSTDARRDTIRDFGTGRDRIHLGSIDADEAAAGNQRFDFIGTDRFSDAAGELRIGGGGSLVLGDTDGDGAADLVIRLAGRPEVGADDFIL
jgi:Ca2+-binding RTX toxin-like protein